MGFNLQAAQALMLNEEFNSKVDSMIQRQGKGKANVSINNAMPKDIQSPNLLDLVEEKSVQSTRKSGLPEAILESFRETPSQVDGISEIPASFLEKISMPLQKEIVQNTPKPRINETLVTNNQQMFNNPNNNGIDYSLIKTIIDESVARQLASFKKTMLTEGTVKAFKVGNGNKVQFLDTQGNLYEGVLTLKKRKTKQ